MAAVAGAAAGTKALRTPDAEAAAVGNGASMRWGVTDNYTGGSSTNLLGNVGGQMVQFWNNYNGGNGFAPALVGLGRKQGLYGLVSPQGIDARFSGKTIGVAAQGGDYGVFAIAKTTGGAAVYGASSVGNALHGESTSGGGSGVIGEAVGGFGVWGQSDSGAGVHGETNSGKGVEGVGNPGVYGTSNAGRGVEGSGNPGVYGSSVTGVGVQGSGQTGVEGTSTAAGPGVSGSGLPGVQGTSNAGSGVLGQTTSGIGVEASVAAGGTGIALHAKGHARFDTSGAGKFVAGERLKAVATATPPGCKILVTLNNNPGPANALKYVKRTATGFTVYLQKKVTGNVRFSWFVIR
jgi:hypothetical protein